MWVFFATTVFGVVGIATRPDQSYINLPNVVHVSRIEDWALVQAKLRMEEDGISLDYKID